MTETASDYLLGQALRAAGADVLCAARTEPLMYDLKRSLHQDKLDPLQAAFLAERLQLCVALGGQFQLAQRRLLDWVVRTAQRTGAAPALQLSAHVAQDVVVLAHSPVEMPRIWEYQGQPNTVLHLEAESFVGAVEQTHDVLSWVVQQAGFQACGVLSSALAHLVELTRLTTSVELLDWPAYERTPEGLYLGLSRYATRAGLWVRELVASRYLALEQAEGQALQTLEKLGLASLEQWTQLAGQASNDEELRALVHGAGQHRVTVSQLKAARAAAERVVSAQSGAVSADAAAQQLKEHFRRQLR